MGSKLEPSDSSRARFFRSYIQKHNMAPLLGGIAGGSASTIILYPLDLIKVRMQVNEEPFHFLKNIKTTKTGHHAATVQARPNQAQTSIERSVLSHIRVVFQKEGALGLYQGLTPALLGSAVSWGGYFYIYESLKRGLLTRKQKDVSAFSVHNNEKNVDSHIELGALENFTAACTAGAALVLITNPIWLVKTRMQLQIRQLKELSKSKPIQTKNPIPKELKIKPYRGILDAFYTIAREEGPMGLYKGAVPALMLVSHGGVQFVAYEFLKNQFGQFTRSKRRQTRKFERNEVDVRNNHGVNKGANHAKSTAFEQLQDSMGYLTMGAVSKMIASTVTYPLQVIKARLQQRSVSILQQTQQQFYTGFMDCTKRIWMNEGIHGFFKGCVPNAIRVAPSAAITFVVYESVMDFFSDEDNLV